MGTLLMMPPPKPLSLKDSLYAYLRDFYEEGHSLSDLCQAEWNESPAVVSRTLMELVAEGRVIQTDSLEFWAV